MKSSKNQIMTLLLLLSPLSQSFSAEQDQLAKQISQTAVFRNPFIWKDIQPPSDVESQPLWSAIETLKRHGLDKGLEAFETFITKNPDSTWTPSVRALLAKYYRENGRY